MPRTDPYKQLRKICLAFPEAIEKVFGGHTTPTYRVRDKIFVMQSGDGERPALWCKAPPGAQRVLVGSRLSGNPYYEPPDVYFNRSRRSPERERFDLRVSHLTADEG